MDTALNTAIQTAQHSDRVLFVTTVFMLIGLMFGVLRWLERRNETHMKMLKTLVEESVKANKALVKVVAENTIMLREVREKLNDMLLATQEKRR